jgi:site-specific recombinase XerD
MLLQVYAGTISSDTATTYNIGMDKFATWLSDRTPNHDTILEWMADLKAHGSKRAAINAWLGGVRSFFGWAPPGTDPIN